MNTFSTALLLVTAHFFGDFVFQNGYIAKEKVKSIYILFVHSWIYTSLILYVLLLVERPIEYQIFSTVFVFTTHALMDSRILLRSFTKEAAFIIDQILHLIVLGIVLIGCNF